MPLGSGLGTFVPVYAMFEKPEDAQDTYVNRAHNEILEIWLETGMLGLALIVVFVSGWYDVRSRSGGARQLLGLANLIGL